LEQLEGEQEMTEFTNFSCELPL